MSLKLVASTSSPPIGGLLTASFVKQLVKVSLEWGKDNSLEISSDVSVDSNAAISRYLARLAAQLALYGTSIVEETEVDHWISFSIGPLSCNQEFNSSLKYLDHMLAPVTYLVGSKLTIADLMVYGTLLCNQNWIKTCESGCPYVNVNRWFKFLSSLEEVATVLGTLPETVLAKTKKEVKSTEPKEEGKFVELPGAEMGKVVVRFPPEASGYLHIGHAKAALLNAYYQEAFKGQLIMRFDDTNPDKEKVDFEKVILEDLKLLQIKPDKFTHTSDHFDTLLSYCEHLLKQGKAYVDDTDPETMKQEREQRVESKNRSNKVDRNLFLWLEMRNGSQLGQRCCVRAKIDMKSDNGCMRDPTIYRCKTEPHPRTGTKYNVYPTYDFACPIVDSIEGVTHALRTMEYHDRDEQFYWFIDVLGLRKPYIWEYSRLNMMNTVLSKRKLTWFVEEGIVESWEDPRFPTVRGVLRRGMTVEGLKQFIIAQGSSRSVVQMEWDKIWAFNKKVIDPIAPRFTALEQERLVKVKVAGATRQPVTVQKHPKNSSIGTKTIYTSPTVLIQADDAALLKEGENATFINWGNVLIRQLHRDGSGAVKEVDAELNLTNTDFKKTLKLTWLADEPQQLAQVEALYFEHIITKPVLAKDEDFKSYINHDSKRAVRLIGDADLLTLKKDDVIQLQRVGYFRCDKPASKNSPVVLINIPDGSSKGAAKQDLSFKEQASASKGKKAEVSPAVEVAATPGELVALSQQDLEQIAVQWRLDREKLIRQASETTVVSTVVDELNEKIKVKGDLVRDLKAKKAEKAVVDAALKTLLALKADYKTATGQDWKPGVTAVSVKPTSVNGGQETLGKRIAEEVELVKRLKTDKADKSLIDIEAKSLTGLKTEYKKLTGEEWKNETDTKAVNSVLNRITEQGEKVRALKAAKAEKPAVEAAVKVLLDLKAEYKTLTGQNWKPNLPLLEETLLPKDSNALSVQIAEQGDKVRTLKAVKAAKPEVEAAVKLLLSLKAEYKALAGVEWKPSAPVVAVKVEPKEVTVDSNALSVQIAEQGDKVRTLKAVKAAKPEVEAAVKVLLGLKAEYRALAGVEWKPSAPVVAVVEPKEVTVDSNALSVQIAEQGDKVRTLKAAKAAKPEVEAAVKVLLNLKADYKALAGVEWKPSAPVVAVKVEPKEVTMDSNALSIQITEQGGKVRTLKSAGAAKEAVDAEVKELLLLKAKYKETTGEEWKPEGGQTGRSKQQGKKEKGGEKKEKGGEKKEKGGKQGKGDERGDSEEKTGPKKQTRLGLEAEKEENLAEWYSQVITKGELLDYYDVSGCYILRPWAYSIWEQIRDYIDSEIKTLGVENCYFPMFVSKAVLEKEKDHIADFSPEVAWVTRSGDSELAEHIAIRPTSETVMYPAYAKWIQSHRDLPLRLNQWNNVVRWEFKHPQPFLRTREFLWQEGHTAFASQADAEKEVLDILDLYSRVYTDLLAIPVVRGRKTEKEKFAGGTYTTTVEAFVSASGRAIQGGTSHHLGLNFSKMFEIVYEDPETQEKKFVFQNSWGITTRTIGVMIMVHGDNQGLVLPPRVAALQVVIVPCGVTASLKETDKNNLLNKCTNLEKQLKDAGVRARLDQRDNYSPGWKFNHWELKGVPLRVELGPKDLEKQQLVAVRRDTGGKVILPLDKAAEKIQTLLNDIQSSMLEKASGELKAHTVVTSSWTEFCTALDAKNIILAPFCELISCEDNIKKDSTREQELEPGAPAMGAKSLCIPFEQPTAITVKDKCIHPACKAKPVSYTLFGRSY